MQTQHKLYSSHNPAKNKEKGVSGTDFIFTMLILILGIMVVASLGSMIIDQVNNDKKEIETIATEKAEKESIENEALAKLSDPVIFVEKVYTTRIDFAKNATQLLDEFDSEMRTNNFTLKLEAFNSLTTEDQIKLLTILEKHIPGIEFYDIPVDTDSEIKFITYKQIHKINLSWTFGNKATITKITPIAKEDTHELRIIAAPIYDEKGEELEKMEGSVNPDGWKVTTNANPDNPGMELSAPPLSLIYDKDEDKWYLNIETEKEPEEESEEEREKSFYW